MPTLPSGGNMQIHNTLSAAQRARTTDALEGVLANLSKCRPSSERSGDGSLFTLDGDQTGVQTLTLHLRSDEIRAFIALRRSGRLHRTSFVERLSEDDPASALTLAQAVPRLSKWRRYLDDDPSAVARSVMEERRSAVVKAVIGAATRLDERWTTLGIYPAFSTKPSHVFMRGPSETTSVFSSDAAKGLGTMSDELVRELSVMSDHVFVTASKPSSNPGLQVEFGPLPGISTKNALSPMDMLHAMRHAETSGLSLHPA